MDAIRNNTAASRFELDAEGGTAMAYYRLADGVVTIHHTETPPHLQGRGIASKLVRGALESVRAEAQGGAALLVRRGLHGAASRIQRSAGVNR